MFSYFKTFMSTKVSPELVDVYVYSLEVMQDFYGDEIISFSEQLIEQVKYDSPEDTVTKVINELVTYLVKAIKQFGVKLNEDNLDSNSVEILTHTLNGLLSLEHYEDVEQLLGTMELSDNYQEVLNELLTIVTGEYFNYYEIISDVSPDLIPRLKEIIVNNFESVKYDDDSIIEQNPLLLKFFEKGFNKHCNTGIGKLLTSNPYRLSLTRILKLYGNRIADDNQWATWLLVILVAKDYNNPETLFSHWENYFIEYNNIVDIKHKVINAYNELLEDE